LINQDSLVELLSVSNEDASLLSIRHSNKAKSLIFKHSIRKGFEIVLPRSYNNNWVLETVTKNKLKITGHLADIKKGRSALNPTVIALPATGQSWKIAYIGTDNKNPNAVTETVTTLYVPGKVEDFLWVPTILQHWLQQKALDHLPLQLDYLARKLKLPYKVVRIKRQRTRWGSCSIRGNINLNRNLMLMPPAAVDYVLHHELAHLKVLNHSPKFWKEIEGSFPYYKRSLMQLKHWENNKIPEWAIV
jgi:predicted metal-dependent hydrolase